jgi:F-type H+-transporting ATPase subunit b
MNGLIDVRQVLTQIFGFLLMVWVLRRYAWGPLMALLDERRDKIAGEFAEAERLKTEAAEAKARFEQEMRSIEAHARQKLNEAVTEGQKVAAEIKTQAQHEAQARLQRAEDEIDREREKAKETLKEQVIHMSMRTAEKILRQKLDDPAQRKLIGEFVDEVGAAK